MNFLSLTNDSLINLDRVDTIMWNKHTKCVEIYYSGTENPQVFTCEDENTWNEMLQELAVYKF